MSGNADTVYAYYSGVKEKPVDWLWCPHIPHRKITVLQGNPGEGKSIIILHIAALFTQRKEMPGGYAFSEAQTVIYQRAEDHLADTIKLRLVAAGAECSKVTCVIDEVAQLSLDNERIKETVRAASERLFILDPLQSFLLQEGDMQNAVHMQSFLGRSGRNGWRFSFFAGMGSDSGNHREMCQQVKIMIQKYRVAGYAKLAKLWERSRDSALEYHRMYYENKYADSENFELVDVYVDITGQKAICKRPAMLRVIRDCSLGKIDCIAAQTKGYLAANTREFCYLIKFLFETGKRIDIITEDEMFHIDTLVNMEQQREALHQMANKYVDLNPDDYKRWEHEIVQNMNKLLSDDMEGGCLN